jgi:SrtB family sortase
VRIFGLTGNHIIGNSYNIYIYIYKGIKKGVNMKQRSFLISCLLALSGILIVGSIYNSDLLVKLNKVNALSPNLIAYNIESLDYYSPNDFIRIRNEYENKDIVGLLKINDTNLKVLVTQATDNNKYLINNIYGERDVRGNPFLDYRVNINSSSKLLIYGHNSDTYDVPFKELENYYDEDFYLNHKYIDLITEQHAWRYKIFSVYVETENWDYMNLDFKDDEEKYNHFNDLKNRSFYDTGEEISPNDNILILQTCSFKNEYANYNKKYLLIIARRVD